MSNERFKHTLQIMDSKVLLEEYYKNNRELEKAQIVWNKNRKSLGVSGDKDYKPGEIRRLKRRRAILLTMLNQNGINGKGFKL